MYCVCIYIYDTDTLLDTHKHDYLLVYIFVYILTAEKYMSNNPEDSSPGGEEAREVMSHARQVVNPAENSEETVSDQ